MTAGQENGAGLFLQPRSPHLLTPGAKQMHKNNICSETNGIDNLQHLVQVTLF